jgi:two-component system LytT family response regulator
MNIIIVDDEPKARRLLRVFIEEYCSHVYVLAEAENIEQAVELILRYKPDVVLLDIEMPIHNGFELFERLDKIDFEVIFTTAHNEYAIKAFQVSAIDYLLKPIQISQLIQAFEKAEKRINANTLAQRIAILQANMQERRSKRIALSLSDGLCFVDFKDIICLKSDGSYVLFFLADGNKILVSKTIKDYESLLSQEQGFFRTHRSFLVNKQHVLRINAEGVLLSRNLHAQLTRDKKNHFELFMKQDID